MGREFRGEWIHVYIWLSPFAVHLKLSQHCLLIGYSPIQNKTFLKKGGGLDLHMITWIEMRNTAWRENIKRHSEVCGTKPFI